MMAFAWGPVESHVIGGIRILAAMGGQGNSGTWMRRRGYGVTDAPIVWAELPAHVLKVNGVHHSLCEARIQSSNL
jgi:hypothetical protein